MTHWKSWLPCVTLPTKRGRTLFIFQFFPYNSRTVHYHKKFVRQKRFYVQFSTKKVSWLFSLECIQRAWTCHQTQNYARSHPNFTPKSSRDAVRQTAGVMCVFLSYQYTTRALHCTAQNRRHSGMHLQFASVWQCVNISMCLLRNI